MVVYKYQPNATWSLSLKQSITALKAPYVEDVNISEKCMFSLMWSKRASFSTFVSYLLVEVENIFE